MSTMNISLPESLKDFVDDQVQSRGYGTRICARADPDRLQLRDLLLAGAESTSASPVDTGYFDGLRDRIRRTSTTKA